MDSSLDNAPCGFFVFADNGSILRVNATLSKMLGYDQDELPKQHLQVLFSPGGRVFYQTHFFPLLKLQGELEEIYIGLRTKSGEEVPFLINARRREENGVAENSCILVRMRQRGHFEDELLKARKSAESANKAKDNFLAALSHELRNPLSPVLMISTAMELDPELSADVREQAATIRRNAELETRLIDDLLDHTRIGHGKLALVIASVDVHGILRETEEIVRSESTAKRIAIEYQLEAAQRYVLGDAARLKQIFWNVIKNAVKFTPAGGKIRVATTNKDDQIVVVIADTGVGIAPEALPHLFHAFDQGNLTGGSFGGLGLGLAISRALVEMHHGSIVAESEGPGRGATFTVKLKTAAPPAPVSGAAPVLAPRTTYLRLLLVEDHDSTREVLARILRRAGHEVQTAGSAAEAIALIGAPPPFDALISDLGLPDISGLELLKAIRANHPRLPAIALSGYGMEEDVKRAHDAGFNAHLVKPVPFDQLRALLDQVSSGNLQ
ncbi:MAG: ATP-binding protein [Chthoniobacterales bacterium]